MTRKSRTAIILIVSLLLASPLMAAPHKPAGSIFSENWDSFTAPPWPANGWDWVKTAGSYTGVMYQVQNTMTHPTATPHSSPNVLRFYSYWVPPGNAGRIFRTSGVDLSGYGGIPTELRFYMYHNSDVSTPDTLQVTVSTDGGANWDLIGPVIERYSTTTGWVQHTQSLDAYTGPGFTDVRVGFLCTSAYGNNIFVDDVDIWYTEPGLAYQSSTVADDTCSSPGPGQHNGSIDPGETVNYNVTLVNNGDATATGLTGTLSTTTTGVTVTAPTSSYPDIPAGGSGTNSTPFVFTVDPNIPCATVIDFNLHVTDTAGGAFDIPFTAKVGTTIVHFAENFDTMSPGSLPSPWTAEVISGNPWDISNEPQYCSSPNFLRYPWHATQAADSWAYSPGANLEAGTTYTLTYNYRVTYAAWPEVLGVYTGDAPNHTAMTITLFPETPLTDETCTQQSVDFTVPSTGTYYIGFHAASPENQYDITVDDVQLISTVCHACGEPCPTITVNPPTLPGGTVGASYNQTVSGSGGVAPYSYGVTSGALPAGLNLDINTGHLSGTPTTAGTADFTITATDSSGCSGSGDYSVAISCGTITVAPSSLPNGAIGVPYSQTVTASGGAAPYTFAVTSGSLPAGLTMNTTGQITGTPTTAGTANFVVTATDNYGCTGTHSYSILISSSCPTITITPASLLDGNVGTAYSQTLSGSGGTAPYTFVITAGGLPAGLTMDSSGHITGTPTTQGTSNFDVTATDNAGCSGTHSYSITITLVCGTITISPTALPAGTTGTPYTQTLTAAGGAAPYTFAVTAGGLPAGLTMDASGHITGTPTTQGTSDFDVTATDNNGCTGSRSYSITVSVVTCLFCDEFDDGTLADNWTYVKPQWHESGGYLSGTPTGKKAVAVATPAFSGCVICTAETTMQTGGGLYNAVWMLSWYADKRNDMELMMKQESGRWILKQRVNGVVVGKAKAVAPISPNVDYAVSIGYDGSQFTVMIDGTPAISYTPKGTVPTGTIGFQAKNTTGSFNYIRIN